MSSAHVVRRALAEDAEAIARVHVAAWQHGYRNLLPDDLLASLSVPQRAEQWRKRLVDAHGAATWVAGDADEPVRGFASAGPSRDDDAPTGTGELYALYVHPASWGTGVGSRLMTSALEVLGDAATLWVLETNQRARRFYARHGWRPDGIRKHETRGTVVLDEVRYRLDREGVRAGS